MLSFNIGRNFICNGDLRRQVFPGAALYNEYKISGSSWLDPLLVPRRVRDGSHCLIRMYP